MIKRVLAGITGSVLLLLSLCAGCAKKDAVAATVDGNRIMQSEVEALVKSMEMKYTSYGVSAEDFYGDEASKAALYDGVLESLIDRELLFGVAMEKGLSALSDAELAALKAEGEAELDTFRKAADGAEDVTLSDMLALYGCTEENYVDTYVSIAEYNRAFDYLTALVTPADSDYSDYYDRIRAQQQKAAEESPQYLGNYAANGTLLYYPEDAAYVEYLVLGEDGILAGKFDSYLLVYGESNVENAVVFPGTTQFSEEIVKEIAGLAPGGETGRLIDENGAYVFRRLADPETPASWEDLPESMKQQVCKNVGEAYVEECLAAVRNGERVQRAQG